MNIDDVLLTSKEKDEVWKAEVKKAGKPSLMGNVWEKALVKAQALKLLEWLKEQGLLRHEIDEHYQGTSEFKPVCVENCRVCKLESKLKEVDK